MEHQFFLTEELPELEALSHRVPLLRDPGDDFYSRQEHKGLLVGIYEQGRFLSEFTMTRLTEDSFWLLSAAAAELYDLDVLNDANPPESVTITNLTHNHNALVIAGPNSAGSCTCKWKHRFRSTRQFTQRAPLSTSSTSAYRQPSQCESRRTIERGSTNSTPSSPCSKPASIASSIWTRTSKVEMPSRHN